MDDNNINSNITPEMDPVPPETETPSAEKSEFLQIELHDTWFEPFTSKSGKEYFDINIPPEEVGGDWAQITVPAGLVHEKDHAPHTRVLSLPADRETTYTLNRKTGELRPNGNPVVDYQETPLPNTEIMDLLAASKEAVSREFTLSLSPNLVEPFTSRSGHELARISIPNASEQDKTPWRKFIVPQNVVKPVGDRMEVTMKERGISSVKRSFLQRDSEGNPLLNAQGQKIYQVQEETLPNTRIKSLLTRPPRKKEHETILCSKNLLDPFVGKDGKEYVSMRFRIPEEPGKSPWARTAFPRNMVRENRSGKSCTITVPKDWVPQVTKYRTSRDAEGKTLFEKEPNIKMPLSEVKGLAEAWMTKSSPDRGPAVAEKSAKQTSPVTKTTPHRDDGAR